MQYPTVNDNENYKLLLKLNNDKYKDIIAIPPTIAAAKPLNIAEIVDILHIGSWINCKYPSLSPLFILLFCPV